MKDIFNDQLIYKYLATHLLVLISIFNIIFNFTFGQIRNPHLIFDESSTLNIISQNHSSLQATLNTDQNLPGYYYLMSVAFKTISSINFVIFLNFVFWLLSLGLVYLISRHYFNKPNSIFFTFLFSLITGISYYSFYFRMYGLVILLELTLIYLFNKFIESKRHLYLGLSFVTLLLLSTLHPLFIFIWAIFFVGFILNSSNSKQRLLIYLSFFVSVASFIYLLLQKNDLVWSYLKGGVDYIRYQTDVYFSFPAHLYFNVKNPFTYIFSALVIILLLKFLVTHIKDKTEAIYTVGIFCFLLIPLSGTFKFTSMHYIFLIPLTYFIFAREIYSNKLNKYIKYTGVSLIFLSSFISSWTEYLHVNYALKNEVCNEVNSLGSGVYVTRFYIYNLVDNCIDKNNQTQKIILSNNKFFDVTNLGKTEVINIQALLGGGYYNNVSIGLETLSLYTKEKYPKLPIYYIPSYDNYLFEKDLWNTKKIFTNAEAAGNFTIALK